METNTNTPEMHSNLLRYLRGELSDDERFELENGPLKKAGVRDTLSALAKNKDSILELEEDFDELRQRWQQRPQQLTLTRTRPWQLIGAIAASLLLVALSYNYYQSQTDNRLYTDYFENSPNEAYLAVRGEGKENSEIAAAFSAYERADYSTSLLQFKHLREAYPFDGQVLLYTGLSAMQLGEYYTARQAFDHLLSIDVSASDRASGHWYLALVYLRQEQAEKAKTELQWLVANNSGELAAKAKKLLAEL